jgi:hypothetical protein
VPLPVGRVGEVDGADWKYCAGRFSDKLHACGGRARS